MESKPIWMSKTLWVNLLALIGTLVMYFSGSITVEQWGGLSGALLAIINVVLRLLTGEPLSLGNDESTR